MKRYIITSPAFSGSVNVLYGTDDKLQFIDFMKCEMSVEQVEFFKTKLPVCLTHLTPSPSPQERGEIQGAVQELIMAFGKGNRLSIVEEGYKVTFDQWFDRYNTRRNKQRCQKIWDKLNEADQVNAFFKLGNYERHLALNTWKTKAEPDTYLRNRYWEGDWTK
jgi:hypothetical protein